MLRPQINVLDPTTQATIGDPATLTMNALNAAMTTLRAPLVALQANQVLSSHLLSLFSFVTHSFDSLPSLHLEV